MSQLSNSKICLRPILPDGDDLQRLEKLAAEIWHSVYPKIIGGEQTKYMLNLLYSPDAIRMDLSDPTVKYHFLEIDGTDQGFSAYQIPATTDHLPLEVRLGAHTLAFLHKFYLHPAHHGKGLGSRFLKLIEAELKGSCQDDLRIILRVNKRNERAIRAYTRNGYYRACPIVTPLGEGYLMDDYLMTKEL